MEHYRVHESTQRSYETKLIALIEAVLSHMLEDTISLVHQLKGNGSKFKGNDSDLRIYIPLFSLEATTEGKNLHSL